MAIEGADEGRRSWLAWAGLAVVLLLGFQAVRSALVAAEGERRPALAHALWPSHPLPQTTLALASIGAAAGQGKPPPPAALEQIRRAGQVDPLAVEPLLVDGTASLAAGDRARGEKLLKAALHREPRSTAGHFLLADLYVREGRVGEALEHVAVLGRRLGGGGAQPFASALAVYLRDPAKVGEVRPMFARGASLRQAVMIALAQDPAGAASLRALVRPGDAGESWFRIAFERELAAGNVSQARGLLAAAGLRGGGTALTSWASGTAAGPLSWALATSSDGIAEADTAGPLRIVYYGRGETSLAEHLLLLAPGRYRLTSQFGGQVSPGTLEWRVTCLQGARVIARSAVNGQGSAQLVDVPADCPAQRLALWGRMGDFPRTTSADLMRVALSPVGAAQ
ncbi:tetratricopeptide repeat protein [Sphingomonas humi]|uniref:Tetratricopeptide repeat protein n=1 Tax=Sphingomonas humi TaxID=335630 RepID=A0ABP7S894_9SPHN